MLSLERSLLSATVCGLWSLLAVGDQDNLKFPYTLTDLQSLLLDASSSPLECKLFEKIGVRAIPLKCN